MVHYRQLFNKAYGGPARDRTLIFMHSFEEEHHHGRIKRSGQQVIRKQPAAF